MLLESQNELLKNSANEYFKLAQLESDGFYRGALVGMRTCMLFTEHQAMADFISGLLSLLSQSKK